MYSEPRSGDTIHHKTGQKTAADSEQFRRMLKHNLRAHTRIRVNLQQH